MWFANYFAYLGLLFITTPSESKNSIELTEELKQPSHVKPIIIASTVDGKVSALDIHKGGKLIWQVDLGNGPLVSSSISKLVYKEDGKSVRLIPSLNGGLFKFDGEAVEAVPFDADQLLSSSFRLAEETVLVGGKETTTSGIDAFSGKVLYSCTTTGCEQHQPTHDSHGVLIVKRQQQTVRSIENRNGHENWNFSVGEINLNFSKGKSVHLLEGSDAKSTSGDKCETEDLEPFCAADAQRIKVIVPDGTICLVTSQNKHAIKWKYQFGTPVSSAWLLYGDKLYKLDLFDPARIPALEKDKPDGKFAPKDTIYMGTYKDHAYIQASPSVQKAIAHAADTNIPGSSNLAQYKTPRFTYRPYLGKADHLTMANLGQGVNAEGSSTELIIKGRPPRGGSCGKVLSVYNEENDKGTGYYLQGDVSYLTRIQKTSRRQGRNTVASLDNDSYDYDIDIVYSSFMHWWKELLILTVSVSIFVQCLIAKIMHARHRNEAVSSSEKSKSETYDLPPNYSLANVSDGMFESRFLQDFEPLECLGKGGFGVVFQARNKMDDCHYAVKRILLPSNLNAREKVLREVRALAKLEHQSIVRYFNAWSEHPPQGWQKQQDETLLKDLSVWTQSPNVAVSEARIPTEGVAKNSDVSSTSSHQPSSCNVSTSSDDHVVFRRDAGLSTTQGFQLNEAAGETGADWTGSFAVGNTGAGQKSKFFQSDSTMSEMSNTNEIRNRNNSSAKFGMPFQRYQQESMSIVFDDGYSSRKDMGSCVFGHEAKRDEVNQQPPPYDDHMSPGLRKRSVSVKVADNSTSELKSVVCCKDDSKKTQEPALATNNEQSNRPERTMYLYIQMQLCKKESLREWLAANVRSRDRTLCIGIFEQVVSAVCYVHDQGLIHRDLKPSNVFFSPKDGTVKVGDFGLVAHVGEDHTMYEGNTSEDAIVENRHTQQVGTRMYMAPEQMTSQNYSKKVDIYALGLILFELSNLFGTQMERIKHLTDARKLKFPTIFVTEFPQEARLAQAMLSSDPTQRPSAMEISDNQLFEQLLNDEGERTHSSRRFRTSSSRSSDSFSLN
uniref:non-specific serine/threonine protein kinase n=1 Tax=Phallusia mammillata TaxID=59560 RepID=A0A6F9DB50_9ASCI|nr:eukaryotic translation initiation factor 2-alpha kinase 3 [Phallusia mammillata]